MQNIDYAYIRRKYNPIPPPNIDLIVKNLTVTELTQPRIPYIGLGGLFVDSAELTFDDVTHTVKLDTVGDTGGLWIEGHLDINRKFAFDLNTAVDIRMPDSATNAIITGLNYIGIKSSNTLTPGSGITRFIGIVSNPRAINVGDTYNYIANYDTSTNSMNGVINTWVHYDTNLGVNYARATSIFHAGFRSTLNIATNAWNFYAAGTAPNFFSGNVLTGSQILAPNGTTALPSYSFTNATGTGLRIANSDDIRFTTIGIDRLAIQSIGLFFIGNTAQISLGLLNDTNLHRDAANIFAQRNGINPQEFRIYNTFTDVVNYERGSLLWQANELVLWTQQAGTGIARKLQIGTVGDAAIGFFTNNFAKWNIINTGHINAASDNNFDIGALNANRPRTGYFGTSLVIGTNFGSNHALRVNSSTGAFLYASGALSGSNHSDTNWIRSPKNTVTLFIGDNDSVVLYTATEYSAALRFNGAVVSWGDIAYFPKDVSQGHFRFFRDDNNVGTGSGTASIGASIGYFNTSIIVSGAFGSAIGAASSSTTNLNLAAGIAGVSSLRVPHGVAPTTPVNGDVWTTTVSMFVRINGVTVDLAAGGGGAYTDEQAQDAIGTILLDSSTIDFTYDDITPSITAIVIDDSITNLKLANMAQNTIKGRITAVTGDPEDLTAAQVRTITSTETTAQLDARDTANRARTVHTGTQLASTISDFAEAVSDQVGTMVTTNTETGITVTYDDLDNTLDFVVTDSPLLGGQNGAFYLSRANHTSTQLASTISDFSEAVDDRVAILAVQGTGITITYNDIANTLTFATTITQYTDEQAQDTIGAILVDSATIDFTYNDVTPSITAIVIDNSITYAKMQDISTASRLLGRGSAAGAGDPEELTIGGGLSLSGTVLSHYRNVIELTADVASIASIAFQNVTGLSFAVTSGVNYRVHCTIMYTTSTNGIGIRFSATGPTMTHFAKFTRVPVVIDGSLTTVGFSDGSVSLNAGITSASSMSTTPGNIAIIDFVFRPSASGTFQLRFAPETATANGVIIEAGSTLEWW